MKKRTNLGWKYLLIILVIYLFWIVLFATQKPIFMIANPMDNIHFSDWINVFTHGLKLDVCVAAYLVFIPILLLIVRVFWIYNVRKILLMYHIVLGILVAIIFAVDTILYSYWQFRMDATLIFYLKNFSDSLNSVTFYDVIKFLVILLPYLFLMYLLYHFMVDKMLKDLPEQNKIFSTISLVILLPLFVIATRGGISTATANIGMVYYCDNQKLNVAAINPTFSLLYSLYKQEDFSKKYIFYDEKICEQEFAKLLKEDENINSLDDFQTDWLTNKRPNILIVILESFSANVVGAVNGQQAVENGMEVTPNLNRLAAQAIVFDSAFSNAMRTDRGVVSILTGFLAQPDMSIIKYPEKTRSLPTMAKVLDSIGYKTTMLYGGDINFANMRSYFYGSMYNEVIDYTAFATKDRLSKWGVNDEKTFSYLYDLLNKQNREGKPFFTTFLTLSSHEPFDVNMHKFQNPYVNSVAYTDSCVGVFVEKLKQSHIWDNTLVVFVADHGFKYPNNLTDYERKKYRIPMMFTCGVIAQATHIKRLVNQTDIPKTIFSAMGLDSKNFIYSRNVLNPHTNNYAYYVYNNGFCFMDNTGYTIWDNNQNKAIEGANTNREMKGKVLLQTLYRDISKR